MRGREKKRELLGGPGNDVDVLAPLTRLELDNTFCDSEDGVVAPETGAIARVEFGSTLTDDDVARNDSLAGKLLDTKPFTFRIATVTS